MTILIINNFMFYKFKLIIILTNIFLSLKLIHNMKFSYNDSIRSFRIHLIK